MNMTALDTLVSVITVCRNGEKTIARTIESVLQQSYGNIEYLVVDGASTDGTMMVVREYESAFHGRLKWVSERDGGIYDAMNKGIHRAQGEIIGMINSDDWYERDSVAEVVDAYRHHGAGVYYGILRVLENDQEVMLKRTNYRYLYRDVVGHPAFFVTADIYRTHGGFRLEFPFAADFELMMRLLHRKVPFIQIDEVLANFSLGGESTIHALRTSEEYLRIRCEYGYMSKSSMRARLIRNRVSAWLEGINARL